MSRTKKNWVRRVRATEFLAVAGAVASLTGLTAGVVSALNISPALVISGISLSLGLLGGYYSKRVASTVSKMPGRKRVFLSYGGGLQPIAADLEEALRKKGVRVWTAKERLRPGENLVEAIEHALEDADSFVVLVSRERSDNVLLEIGMARAMGKRILPVLVESADIPSDAKGLVYIDLRADRERGIEKVVSAVT